MQASPLGLGNMSKVANKQIERKELLVISEAKKGYSNEHDRMIAGNLVLTTEFKT